MRSLLFMPGNRERMLAKTPTMVADGVIWDLEDAVPWEEKQAARELVRQVLAEQGVQFPDSLRLYVRVNPEVSDLLEADLGAVAGPCLHGVMLPKVESAEQVLRLDRLLGELEEERRLAPGSIKVLILVETALGVIRAYDSASVCGRVEAVCFGGEDFTRDLGIQRTPDGDEIHHARCAIVLAAAAAGLQAVDTVYTSLDDLAGLERDCALARRLGFGGKLAIHPRQVDLINRTFAPTEADLAFARRVVEAFADPAAAGRGVVVVNGKMVDKPVVERARRLLSEAAARRPPGASL